MTYEQLLHSEKSAYFCSLLLPRHKERSEMRLIYCPSPCPQGQTETAEGSFDFLQGGLSHAGGGGKLGLGEGAGGAERGDAEGFEALAGAGAQEAGGGEGGLAFGGVEPAG